jgi:hypothetical protein
MESFRASLYWFKLSFCLRTRQLCCVLRIDTHFFVMIMFTPDFFFELLSGVLQHRRSNMEVKLPKCFFEVF